MKYKFDQKKVKEIIKSINLISKKYGTELTRYAIVKWSNGIKERRQLLIKEKQCQERLEEIKKKLSLPI